MVNTVERLERNARTASFLAQPDAELYPAGPLVILLCLVSMLEGFDAGLFPASTNAMLEGRDVCGDLPPFGFDNITNLSVIQSLFQAFSGFFWGTIATKGLLHRKWIIVIGTFFQGLATFLMPIRVAWWPMMPLRAVNGFMLSTLRPIAFSIVGDRFDDYERGKYFGFVQGSMMLGGAICGTAATWASQKELWGMCGWRWSFWIVGVLTMALVGPLVLFLKAPAVAPETEDSKVDMKKIVSLFKKWSFTGIVVQGMFGLFPWRALEFRTLFLQKKGMTNGASGFLNSTGLLFAAIGSSLGGFVSDMLAKISLTHGRVATAEISVYSGLPISYMTFLGTAPTNETGAFVYFFVCIAGLGLIGSWSAAGTNAPILTAISEPKDRSAVLSYQTSLEGSIGALGPAAFRIVFESSWGANIELDCLKGKEIKPGCEGVAEGAGLALFVCCFVPWLLCGLVYTSLHFSYPADLAASINEREKALEMAKQEYA